MTDKEYTKILVEELQKCVDIIENNTNICVIDTKLLIVLYEAHK